MQVLHLSSAILQTQFQMQVLLLFPRVRAMITKREGLSGIPFPLKKERKKKNPIRFGVEKVERAKEIKGFANLKRKMLWHLTFCLYSLFSFSRYGFFYSHNHKPILLYLI